MNIGYINLGWRCASRDLSLKIFRQAKGIFDNVVVPSLRDCLSLIQLKESKPDYVVKSSKSLQRYLKTKDIKDEIFSYLCEVNSDAIGIKDTEMMFTTHDHVDEMWVVKSIQIESLSRRLDRLHEYLHNSHIDTYYIFRYVQWKENKEDVLALIELIRNITRKNVIFILFDDSEEEEYKDVPDVLHRKFVIDTNLFYSNSEYRLHCHQYYDALISTLISDHNNIIKMSI